MSGRQIDRLLERAGRNNELKYCECFLDGEDYSYYVKPLTPAQFEEAQKGSKKGETNSSLAAAVKLFALRALNADGTRQYQADAFPVLMRLPMDDLTELLNATGEEGDDTQLDVKSVGEGTEEGEPVSCGIGGSGEARKNAD